MAAKINRKVIISGFFGLVAVGTVATQTVENPLRAESNTMHHSSTTAGNDAHTDHSTHPDHSMPHGSHHGHSPTKQPATSSPQLKLVTAKTAVPNQSTILTIDVQEPNGKRIAEFDSFHEKLMHMIIVDDNLQVFDHLHPTHKGNGQFEVQATFPQPGTYTIFTEYKPAGQPQLVSVLKTTVPGAKLAAPAPSTTSSKTVGNTKATLAFSEPTIKAGQEVTATFALTDAASNQPVQDLQPYLGEQGHLVIVRQSDSLTRADYIHAHAMKSSSTNQIQFMTQFPKPGKYKLWGQFNRNQKIVVADFWVNVL